MRCGRRSRPSACCIAGVVARGAGRAHPLRYHCLASPLPRSIVCPAGYPDTPASPPVAGCSFTNGYPVAPSNDGSGSLAAVAAHSPFFSLPVFSLVIITILNDGCMITISGDYVLPSRLPQRWDMWKVWLIATVLGAVALLSSLILVAQALNANYLRPGTIVGTLWGSRGRTYLEYYEVQTIMYLKVSISDFLTLFSARTRGPFFERRLSTPLLIAFFFATGASTLLALFWGDIFASQPSNFMASLRFSNGAVVATWVYCLLWWVVQDAAKLGAYWLIDHALATDADKALAAFGRARETSALPQAAKPEHRLAIGEQAVLDHHAEEQAAAAARLAGAADAPPQLAVISAVAAMLGGGGGAPSARAAAAPSTARGSRAPTPAGTLGRDASLGRRAVPLVAAGIPDGTDLNVLLRQAQLSLTAQAAAGIAGTVGRTALPPRAPALSAIFAAATPLPDGPAAGQAAAPKL